MAFNVVGKKFNFGTDIDDMWRHAGLPDPPSTIIPFILTEPTVNGRFFLGNSKMSYERRNFTGSLTADQNKHNTKKLARSVAAFLVKNKIDYVRAWFPWNFFQHSVGDEYIFPLDNFVNEMTDSGIGIIAVIGDGYHRFIPPNAQTSNLKEYIKELTDSSTAIVNHYKSKIKTWQIENEPNAWIGQTLVDWRSGSVWLSPNSQWPILKALHDVVRNASSSSKIVINVDYIGGTGTKWSNYAKYCDILGIDYYPSYMNPFQTKLPDISQIIDQAYEETHRPIYIIETGYASGPGILGFNERHQAEFVASACESIYSNKKVSGLGLYRFTDSYWRSFPPEENYFGLLDVTGNPKPAWNEYVRHITNYKKKFKV